MYMYSRYTRKYISTIHVHVHLLFVTLVEMLLQVHCILLLPVTVMETSLPHRLSLPCRYEAPPLTL